MNKILSLVFLTILLTSCNTSPEQFNIGKDNCNYCKMTISDARFGIEIITNKGKILKFDDIKCMLGFIEQDSSLKEKIKNIYVANYLLPTHLINIKEAQLLHSIDFRSPMNGNIAAFDNIENLHKINKEFKGSIIKWEMLYK
jgi:copper chaperone NosL